MGAESPHLANTEQTRARTYARRNATARLRRAHARTLVFIHTVCRQCEFCAGVCRMLQALARMQCACLRHDVPCCMCHVACATLHVARCMSHVACYIALVCTWQDACMLHVAGRKLSSVDSARHLAWRNCEPIVRGDDEVTSVACRERCNIQHATHNKQHATSSRQRATRDTPQMQTGMRSMQDATRKMNQGALHYIMPRRPAYMRTTGETTPQYGPNVLRSTRRHKYPRPQHTRGARTCKRTGRHTPTSSSAQYTRRHTQTRKQTRTRTRRHQHTRVRTNAHLVNAHASTHTHTETQNSCTLLPRKGIRSRRMCQYEGRRT